MRELLRLNLFLISEAWPYSWLVLLSGANFSILSLGLFLIMDVRFWCDCATSCVIPSARQLTLLYIENWKQQRKTRILDGCPPFQNSSLPGFCKKRSSFWILGAVMLNHHSVNRRFLLKLRKSFFLPVRLPYWILHFEGDERKFSWKRGRADIDSLCFVIHIQVAQLISFVARDDNNLKLWSMKMLD